jgi:hypothetical protein
MIMTLSASLVILSITCVAIICLLYGAIKDLRMIVTEQALQIYRLNTDMCELKRKALSISQVGHIRWDKACHPK